MLVSILKLSKRHPVWLRKYRCLSPTRWPGCGNWRPDLLSDFTDNQNKHRTKQTEPVYLWVQGQPDLQAPGQQGLQRQSQNQTQNSGQKSHLSLLHQIWSFRAGLSGWVLVSFWSSISLLSSLPAFGIIMSIPSHSWKYVTHCFMLEGLQLRDCLECHKRLCTFELCWEYQRLRIPKVGLSVVSITAMPLCGPWNGGHRLIFWLLGPHVGKTI